MVKPEATTTNPGVDRQTAISLLEEAKTRLQSLQINFCEVLMQGGKKYGEFVGIHCCLDTRKFTQAEAEALCDQAKSEITSVLGEYRSLMSVQVQASGHPFTYQTRAAEEKGTAEPTEKTES